MSFKKLLGELKDLTKSEAGDAGDANIQAAGATGGDSNNGGAGAGEAGGDGKPGGEGGTTNAGATGGEGDGKPGSEGGEEGMEKSFTVTLPDGTEVQAVDAGEMLKALSNQVTTMETEAGEVMGMCVTMIKSLVAENDKLTKAVAKLASSGSGRQAVLSIIGKTTSADGGASNLNKSEVPAMKPQEFLTKAEQAFNGKALSGRDLSLAEAHINRGEAVPAHIIQAVMGFGGKAA